MSELLEGSDAHACSLATAIKCGKDEVWEHIPFGLPFPPRKNTLPLQNELTKLTELTKPLLQVIRPHITNLQKPPPKISGPCAPVDWLQHGRRTFLGACAVTDPKSRTRTAVPYQPFGTAPRRAGRDALCASLESFVPTWAADSTLTPFPSAVVSDSCETDLHQPSSKAPLAK